MKRFTPILVWSLLVAIAISGLFTLVSYGPSILFKSYANSSQFENRMEEVYETIGRTGLNPVDLEEAEKKLTVSSEEIATYRTYYGSLPEQIDNIQMQYEDRIQEAQAKPSVKQALVDERDGKIEDIRKNFEEDAYVEEKIISEKKRQLAQMVSEYENNLDKSNIPFSYNLKPVDGEDVYKSGEGKGNFAYERKFNSQKGYLRIHGFNASSMENGYYEETTTNYMDSAVQYGEGVSLSREDVNAINQPTVLYEGTVAVPMSAFQRDGVLYDEAKNYQSVKVMLIVLGVTGIAALIALFTIWKFKWSWFIDLPVTKWYDSLRIDVKMGVFLILLLYVLDFTRNVSYRVNSMSMGGYSFNLLNALLMFAMATIVIAFLTFQIGNASVRYQQPEVFKRDLQNSYAIQLVESMKDVFLNRSIGVQTLILLVGFFLAGIGFVAGMFDGFLFLIYLLCVLFLGLPVLYIYMRRMGYLSKILKATDEMAAGRLNRDIEVIGRSPFAAHAVNLNNLREGVEQSVSSQAKSERMKTELITNVSHDLRTPLTSIITYTDLLKNPNLSDEERAEYVDVLDRKSQRLKTLIEDLFEVSKMSSGTMELYKQRVDLGQLVQQAIGEHTEKMAEIPLSFRVSVPEEPLPAILDGQRWWRMLDNLIGNALKYSLPGTRVFVTLKENDGLAELVIKNITAYELDENVDELYDRFKRGDASRHTDGSGLGLAIAQSIVEMHGGTMAIDVDGDLFKVTVRIPVAY